MFEENGYVNYWTEFLIAHVGALHDYTLDYADTRLAKHLWDAAPITANKERLGLQNYSLTAYYDESKGMVVQTPRPLIDWPRSTMLDTNSNTACK